MSAANAAYEQQLCALLGVSNPLSQSATAGTQDSTADALPANTAAQPATAAAALAPAGVELDPSLVNAQTSVQHAAIDAGGISFPVLLDLFAHYVATPVSAAASAAEQEAATAAEAVATAKQAAAMAAEQAIFAASAAADAAAATAATTAPTVDAKAAKGSSKDAKTKAAAAASKTKEAAGAAAGKGAKAGSKQAADDKAAAEAPVVEAPPPAPQFVFEGVAVPKAADGAALCQDDSVPGDTIRAALETVQVTQRHTSRLVGCPMLSTQPVQVGACLCPGCRTWAIWCLTAVCPEDHQGKLSIISRSVVVLQEVVCCCLQVTSCYVQHQLIAPAPQL